MVYALMTSILQSNPEWSTLDCMNEIVDSMSANRWAVGRDFLVNFWTFCAYNFDFAKPISETTSGLYVRWIVHKIRFVWLN